MCVSVANFGSTSGTLKALAFGPIVPGKEKKDAVAPAPAAPKDKEASPALSRSSLLINPESTPTTGLNIQS